MRRVSDLGITFHLSVSELPTHFALSAALNSLTYTATGFPGNGL